MKKIGIGDYVKIGEWSKWTSSSSKGPFVYTSVRGLIGMVTHLEGNRDHEVILVTVWLDIYRETIVLPAHKVTKVSRIERELYASEG